MTRIDQTASRVTRAQGAAVRRGRVVGRQWRRRIAGAVGCIAVVGAVASCDASKALRPGARKDVRIEFNGDSTVIVGSTVPLSFGVIVDGEPYPFPRLEVVSSDTNVVALGGDGRSL